MPKAGQKKGIEVKLEDQSNVSKIVVKQGIEAEVWDIVTLFQ